MKSQSAHNLSTKIYALLKDRIIHWQYPPGHRFTEEGLCDEFNVSRSPIREVLRMLVENGLVEKQPFKSYSVRQLDLQEIHELYDVRSALELFIVERLITQGMPLTEWEDLHSTWQTILDHLPQTMNDFADKDEQFHETLAACTGNKILIQYLHNIDERLHFIRMSDITTTERLRTTCEHHLRILECIREKDINCAREAILMNIEEGRKNVEQAVKEALAKVFMGLKASALS